MSSRNSPLQPLVDLINRITNKRGAVVNLHGNVFDVLGEDSPRGDSRWFYVQGEGRTPKEILVDAALNDRSASVITGSEGEISFQNVGDRVSGSNLLVYTGIVTPESSAGGVTTAPISVLSPGAEIAIYVDDTPVLRGVGSLSTDVVLGTGHHVIQIVLSRASFTDTRISFPPDLSVGHYPLPPGVPSWDETPVTFGFTGTTELSAAARLFWWDSSFAGSWKIERTSYRLLGEVESVTFDDETDTFTFVVSGLHPTAKGVALVDEETVLGPITGVTVNATNTDILVLSTVAEGAWDGKSFFVSDVQAIVANVEREDAIVPEDGVFSYTDTGIKESVPYTYRLASVHPLHANVESAWSSAETIFALDDTPPGDVSVTSVEVVSGAVVVTYVSPSDKDYMGVRVFFESGGSYVPILNDFGRPGQEDQLAFYPPSSGTYWLRTFDWARNIQVEGNGISFEWDGSTGISSGPPEISFKVLPTDGWDPLYRTDVEVEGYFADPEDERTVTGLEYYLGTTESYIDPGTNPFTLTFSRDEADLAPRVLNVRATASDGSQTRSIFVVDWNRKPGISNSTVQPRYSGQVQIGWTLLGATDDDARSVVATVNSGDATIDTAAIVNTPTTKNFTFEISQDPGETAEVWVTPYELQDAGGDEGEPVKHRLIRNPISFHLLREISLTQVEVTLVGLPDASTIKYRYYNEGASPPAFSDYSSPVRVIRNAAVDVIFEYYAVLGTLEEEPRNKLRIDTDTEPEIEIVSVVEYLPNQFLVQTSLDDDSAHWKYWARKGSWPTSDGTEADQPNDDYLMATLPSSVQELTHYASTGLWYIMVQAFDFSDNPGQVETYEKAANGDTSGGGGGGGGDDDPGGTVPALSNLRVRLVTDGSSNSFHRIKWDHSDPIEDAYTGGDDPQYDVEVYVTDPWTNQESLIGTRRAVLDVESGSSEYTMDGDTNTLSNEGSFLSGQVSPGTKGDPFATWVTYKYRVALKEDGVLLWNYKKIQISGYYLAQ